MALHSLQCTGNLSQLSKCLCGKKGYILSLICQNTIMYTACNKAIKLFKKMAWYQGLIHIYVWVCVCLYVCTISYAHFGETPWKNSRKQMVNSRTTLQSFIWHRHSVFVSFLSYEWSFSDFSPGNIESSYGRSSLPCGLAYLDASRAS